MDGTSMVKVGAGVAAVAAAGSGAAAVSSGSTDGSGCAAALAGAGAPPDHAERTSSAVVPLTAALASEDREEVAHGGRL
jgi:hypothetical protein